MSDVQDILINKFGRWTPGRRNYIGRMKNGIIEI